MRGIEAAEALERRLGDPTEPDNPHGYAAIAARDERDVFPGELVAALRETGFHLNYLPERLGGTFTGFDDSMTLVRTAARRDLAAMPGTMFSITAAVCLLLRGSPEQLDHAAELLREGESIGFALSEAGHGSDLLANTVRLRPAGDGAGGMLLDGRKWLVGRGQTCPSVLVVARTGERGPGAFTSVLVDLTAPGCAARVRRGAPVRTTGMRGIDFADLEFDAFPVRAEQVVGSPGQGLDAAVRAQQVVRVMSLAGSLGCADTGMRLALGFAGERTLGRKPLLEAGHPRRELAVAAAALLTADATALAAARGLHVAPETFSVWGSAAKHAVAEAASEVLDRCAGVLSSRAVLRAGGPGGGLFQKLQRDAALVRVVDTSVVANLRSFAGQLPAIAERMRTAGDEEALAGLTRDACLTEAERPPFKPELLDLSARGREPVTAHAALLAPRLAEDPEAFAPGDPAGRQVARLADALAALPEQIAGAPRGGEALTDLAERFCWLHAAACCLLQWWHHRTEPLFGGHDRTGWLGATLAYALACADGTDPRREAEALAPALETVRTLLEEHRLFSGLPVRLADRAVPTDHETTHDQGETWPHPS